jgi:hypothetical protein
MIAAAAPRHASIQLHEGLMKPDQPFVYILKSTEQTERLAASVCAGG